MDLRLPGYHGYRHVQLRAAAGMRPDLLRPQVEPPTLSRLALQELQAIPMGVVDELEESWERRN